MSNRWGKIAVMTAVVILFITGLSTGGTVAASSKFKDIDENYREYIEYLYAKNIIEGYSETKFGSKDSITREQAAKIVVSAKGLELIPGKTKFPDANNEYAEYINAAVKAGFITGYPDRTFRPKNKITRGEMAYLITKAFGFTKTSNVFYTDVTPGTAQYDVINKLTTAGITNGTSGGKYSPHANMPREQFAAFVARSLNPAYRVEYKMAAVATKYVAANELNVRTGPGTNYSVKGAFKQNEEIQLFGTVGTWAYASNGKLEGYVHTGYLVDSLRKGSRTVAVDAGHGGHDPGASANGLVEKELNLDVSLRTEKYLKAKGINVVMTRRTDTYLTLQQRVNVSVRGGADTFVSIHGNSFTPSANGTETFYYAASINRTQHSKQLATFIQNRLVKALGTNYRRVDHGNFHVLRENPLPAALVELAFLTNAADAQKLKSDYYREEAAKAIANGIEDYYKWKESQ